jgi:hypothetical protein
MILFGANALHRVGSLMFQLALGHAGGVEAVGVASSALAMAWVGGSFGSLGLPDRAMYATAGDALDPTLGRAHGLFLLMTSTSAIVVTLVVVTLHDHHVALALAMVTCTFLQQTAAFSFSALRGLSRPRLEAVAWSSSSIVLLAGAAMSMAQPRLPLLAATFVASGACVLPIALLGLRTHAALTPRMPSVRGALDELRSSASYLLVGAGGMLLGSADVIGAQLFLDDTEVGLLHCGTLVLRTGLAAPWFVSVLALRVQGGRRPSPSELVAFALLAWALVSIAAWVAVPWVGLGYAIDADRFSPITLAAIGLSLPSYVATALLPRAMMEHRRATVRVFALLGLVAPALFAVGAWAGATRGLQIAHAGGYLLLALSFARLLFSGSARRTEPAEARSERG